MPSSHNAVEKKKKTGAGRKVFSKVTNMSCHQSRTQLRTLVPSDLATSTPVCCREKVKLDDGRDPSMERALVQFLRWEQFTVNTSVNQGALK